MEGKIKIIIIIIIIITVSDTANVVYCTYKHEY
jgi:hypothetical protein